MKYLQLCLFIILTSTASSQSSFRAELSRDSVLLGNTFTLKYVLENIDGNFEAPDLSNLNVISGPNMSSSFQFVNGASSQSISYSYTVQPLEEGEIIIDQAFVISDDQTYESDFIEINVYPNPDGIIEEEPQMIKEFRFNFPFEMPKEEKETKKKRKYKIKKI